MLEVEIYRYDIKMDWASYFKPYIYKNADFKDLKELFYDIKKQDPYFEFKGVKFVKVNDCLVNLDENFNEILNKTGNFIKISPLIEKRSIKDEIINNDDFMGVFDEFSQNLGDEILDEKDFYLNLEPLFYSSDIRDFKDDFLGNSAFVFAYNLIQKFPNKKEKILDFIKDQIYYYQKPKFLLNDPFNTENIIQNLRKMLNLKDFSKQKIVNFADIKNKNFKTDFSQFNIAVYNDKDARNFIKKIANLKEFNSQERDCGYEIYKFDKEVAIKVASNIIFDAFDSGADFLLVNNESDFFMFDTLKKDLQYVKNRSLHDFYVLKSNEFLDLLDGKRLNFDSHKLKVGLL
ncbi:hypothetical protein F1B92_07515 [Campylobacter sp. FMV-PI01]|uniref:HdrB-like C-terminal domain-containing protein n=1 Tax=Campylobacter portucalensis TaxID=2608384 RepID=A0A6L5WL56_9BACT|nr:hypothetical protein [Campylobacter portucalensis]MSN97007.1 hypothetical protein [Campylobacter portucalensis]